MANKNIRDIIIKVSGKDLATAASESEKLNNNLTAVINTAKGAGRNFKSINTALANMAATMKDVNSSMNATKIRTKGLETYQKRMAAVKIILNSVKGTAQDTAKALVKIDDTTQSKGFQSMSGDVGKLNESFGKLEKSLRIAIVQLREIVENTGKTSARLKQTREITNQSSEAIEGLAKSYTKAKKKGDDFNNSARGLGGEGRNQKRAFSELAFTMNPITSIYASIAINVYALSEAFRVLNEAANLQRLVANLENFSAAVGGLNITALAQDMSKLSGSILSVEESLRFATKGAAFNFTAEQLEKLTVGARKASIALGINFTDAMDRTLRGISKQEIELFDELGVVTRLTPAFEKYGAEVGKTVEQLTDYERQLALTNEVQRQFDTRFSGITISATPWEELGKAVKDTSAQFLIFAQESLTPVAEGLTKVLNILGKYTDGITDSNLALASLDTSLEALRNGSDYAGESLTAYTEYLKLANKETEDLSNNTSLLPSKFNGLFVILSTVAGAALGLTAAFAGLSAGTWFLTTGMTALTAAATTAKKALIGVIAIASKHPVLAVIGVAVGALAGAYFSMNAAMETSEEKTAKFIESQKTAARVAADTAKIMAGLAAEGINLVDLKSGDDFAKFVQSRQEEAGRLFLQRSEALERQVSLGLISASKQQRALAELNKDSEKDLNKDNLFREFLAVKVAGPIKAAKSDLVSLTQTSNATITSMKTQSTIVSELLNSVGSLVNLERDIVDGLASSKGNIESLNDVIDELKEKTGASFSSLKELRDILVLVETSTLNLATTMDRLDLENKFSGANGRENLQGELKLQKEQLAIYAKAPDLFKEQSRELQNKISLLEQELKLETTKLTVSNAVAALEYKSLVAQEKLAGTFERTYGPIKRRLDLLTQQYKVEKSNANLSDKALARLEIEYLKEKKLLDIQLKRAQIQDKLTKDAEKASLDLVQVQNAFSATNNVSALGGRRESEVTKAGQNTTLLELEKREMEAALARDKSAGISPQDEASRLSDITAKGNEAEISRIKEQSAAYRDMAAAIGEVAGSVPGLTEIQEQFIGMSATVADTIANTTELIASGQELTLSDFSDSIIAVGTMASSMFSELTKGVVADIDNQIAAEKRRDGKSQESLAKIQALEKKKIKEQEKSKIAQTAMSTSLAIMKTMAEVPFPGNLAMSAAIGAMGMMQINNIKKASAGQMAALQTDTGGLSLSVGSRNNAVDIGQGASRGELSFLRGEAGTGTGANNFTPGRSGGGSVVVGERGPETITPTQPINVTPASETNKEEKPSVNQTLNLSIQAIDSQSIEDRSDDIWMALERAANERGYTLNSLS